MKPNMCLQPTLRPSRRLQGVSEEEDKESVGKRRARRAAAEADVRLKGKASVGV